MCFSFKQAEYVVDTWVAHYNTQRSHQGRGLNNSVLDQSFVPKSGGVVKCQKSSADSSPNIIEKPRSSTPRSYNSRIPSVGFASKSEVDCTARFRLISQFAPSRRIITRVSRTSRAQRRGKSTLNMVRSRQHHHKAMMDLSPLHFFAHHGAD